MVPPVGRGKLPLGAALAPPLLALCAVLGACTDTASTTPDPVEMTSAPSAATPYPTGLSEHTLDVDSVPRSYLVYVPPQVVQPTVVVLVLHGGGGEGLGVAEEGSHVLSVFRSVAEREGFVAVYPEGLPANDRQGLVGWVDCRSDNSVASGVDDIGFLATLSQRVAADYGLPPSKIFMAGNSNGAQMTQAFAFHHPELLGAVASGAGSLPENPLPGRCTEGPAQPIPIVLLHGTADTQMPYDGGCVANLAGACNRGRVVSAESTRDRWLAINGLSGVTSTEEIVEVDSDDGGSAHRFVYDGDMPVEWWRLDGAGHTGASRTVLVAPNRLAGTQNRDIEFAEVAWSFFARQLPAG